MDQTQHLFFRLQLNLYTYNFSLELNGMDEEVSSANVRGLKCLL